ncbi:MAG: menE 1 [Marmoricola sp.]|nr:menE 1 [Marmoricola sp.]
MRSRDRLGQLLDGAPAEAEAIEFEESWTTWGSLQEIDRALDQELTSRGLGEGARVGVILESRPEHVGVLVALIARGRCIVTVSPMQPPERLSADIAASDVPVLVGTAEALSRPGVRDAAGDAVVLELGPGTVTSVGPAAARESRPEDSSPGIIVEMLTSGTTGPPKRVRLNERQFDSALSTSVPAPPDGVMFRRGVTVVVTPLVHIGGFWGALGPLYAGRRVVLLGKFALEPWLRAVETYRPRAAGLVPAALRAVLKAGVEPDKLASIDVVTTGTTACPPELVDAFLETYGIRVLPTYGATEFAGAVAYWTKPMHEQWWATKAGSAGRALPGVALRVTDPDGDELAPGETGHLEIRSRQSPVGADQWLRTSDLAAVDGDGFLWIRGRADDAIVRGGFKVHPETVRKALEQHPAVHEAAVAPLPDERLGQVPVAGVEVEAGVGRSDDRELVAELVALCRQHLMPYEIPVHIAILDALPRTPSTKVSRIDLVERIVAAMATDVPA